MSGPINWGLVTCPDHQYQGAVHTGTAEAISTLRAGCTACRITLTCQGCGWISRHVVWASAVASQEHHECEAP